MFKHGDFMELGNAKVVTNQQAARLKAIKAAAEKLRSERKLAVRRKIEELKEKSCE